MSEHPERIVLGEGYPWGYYERPDGRYRCVGMKTRPHEAAEIMGLQMPESLWMPRYRLVLERVEE